MPDPVREHGGIVGLPSHMPEHPEYVHDSSQSAREDGSSPWRCDDETEALYFLRSVITDSGLMHDLRTWLLSENHSSVMYAIADDDVMGHIARMLASGEIAAATMEIGEGEGEGAGLGEEEGILRKSGVFAATPSTATETTPRQDEVARREQ